MQNLLQAPFVQAQAVVIRQESVSSRYFLLRLLCQAVASRAQPGQFVMLGCAHVPDGTCDPLLPRPLAVMDAHAGEIELLYFVAGRGTHLLRRAGEMPGTVLSIIGPLGQGFEPIKDVDAHIGLGGGSGIAPLVFFFRKHAKKLDWHLVLAARSADQLAREDVVQAPGILHRATDDGSCGMRGTAVDALSGLLQGELKGRRVGVYAAGPEPMMRAAATVCQKAGLPIRVSLESPMACGVGVCRACVVDGIRPHPKTGLLRRTVCQDGPVFDVADLAGWRSP